MFCRTWIYFFDRSQFYCRFPSRFVLQLIKGLLAKKRKASLILPTPFPQPLHPASRETLDMWCERASGYRMIAVEVEAGDGEGSGSSHNQHVIKNNEMKSQRRSATNNNTIFRIKYTASLHFHPKLPCSPHSLQIFSVLCLDMQMNHYVIT